MDPDQHLYTTQDKLRLFNHPLEKHFLKYSNTTLESWIDVMELELWLDKEEHARRTLDRRLEKNQGED